MTFLNTHRFVKKFESSFLLNGPGAVMGGADRQITVIAKRTGWYVELRRVKTGAAVSCPIPNSLAKSFHALDGETPFWSGKSDLEDLTKNWRKIYRRIFKAAGVKGRPHQFRHTAAKRLLVKGVSAGFVASILGDSEAVVRKHYSKWIPERQTALDDAVRATWG